MMKDHEIENWVQNELTDAQKLEQLQKLEQKLGHELV